MLIRETFVELEVIEVRKFELIRMGKCWKEIITECDLFVRTERNLGKVNNNVFKLNHLFS
jgi:hypothetical protein